MIQPDHEAQVIIRTNEWTTFSNADEFGLPTAEQLEGVEIDPALLALVQQLEHPSFAERERATQVLIESSPDRLQLYALLSNSDLLSPEQRYRVLTALRESLLRTPRGAIGISMQPVQQFGVGTIEIRVTDLIPGLPAERVLKLGDRITHVDGRPLTMHDDLQFRVQSKKPGDIVQLTVKRAKPVENLPPAVDGLNEEELFDVFQIQLELGSTDLLREFNEAALNQANRMDPALRLGLSRVERNRLNEARIAGETLAPRPRPISVEGESRLVGRPTAQIKAIDLEVEQHPFIRELLWQQQRLDLEIVTAEDMQMLTIHWQRQLEDLYQQTQDDTLTRDRRDFLNRVIKRYLELLQP